MVWNMGENPNNLGGGIPQPAGPAPGGYGGGYSPGGPMGGYGGQQGGGGMPIGVGLMAMGAALSGRDPSPIFAQMQQANWQRQQMAMQRQKFAMAQKQYATEQARKERVQTYIASNPDALAGMGITAEMAQVLGPEGVGDAVLAQLKRPAVKGTSSQREYELAVSEGFQGNFMDYERMKANYRPAAGTSVTVNNVPGTKYAQLPPAIAARIRAMGGNPDDYYLNDGRLAKIQVGKQQDQARTATQFGQIAQASLDTLQNRVTQFSKGGYTRWLTSPVDKYKDLQRLKVDAKAVGTAIAAGINLKGEAAESLGEMARRTFPDIVTIAATDGAAVQPAIDAWKNQLYVQAQAAQLQQGAAAAPTPNPAAPVPPVAPVAPPVPQTGIPQPQLPKLTIDQAEFYKRKPKLGLDDFNLGG